MPAARRPRPCRRRQALLGLLAALAQPARAAQPAPHGQGQMLLVTGPDVDASLAAQLAALGRAAGLQPQRVAVGGDAAALQRLQARWRQLHRDAPPGPVVIVGLGLGARLATQLAVDLDAGPRPLLLWLLGAAGDAGFPRDDLARFEARCAADDARAPTLLMVDGDADPRLDAAQRQALLAALPSATVIGIPHATHQSLLAERGHRLALESLLRGWVQRRGGVVGGRPGR